MKALLINCTLKASPEKSNTEALAEVVADALRKEDVEVATVRAADHSIPPGVESEMGEGDAWPGIRARILDSEILIFATPTWLAHLLRLVAAVQLLPALGGEGQVSAPPRPTRVREPASRIPSSRRCSRRFVWAVGLTRGDRPRSPCSPRRSARGGRPARPPRE